MEFDQMKVELNRLCDLVRGLGAIGGALKSRRDNGMRVHPLINEQLKDVTEVLLPGGVDHLNQQQITEALSVVSHALEEALDVLDEPQRPPKSTIRKC